jgi:hypothetical protein
MCSLGSNVETGKMISIKVSEATWLTVLNFAGVITPAIKQIS